MAVNLQDLQKRFPIVDPDGRPSQYFLQYLKDRGGNLTDLDVAIEDMLSRQVIAGTGLTGGGPLSADVTLSADEQAILDQISTTHGAVLYRGSADWAALSPGTDGDVLTTHGASANPTWETPAAGGGGGTSWSNGIGYRVPFVKVTVGGTSSGNAYALLGATPSNSFFWTGTTGTQSLTFDFYTALIIDGVEILQGTTTTQGTWDIDGSNDGSTWTGLDTGWSWAPALSNNSQVYRVIREFSNSTAYRYYRLNKTSGSTSSVPYVTWMAFKTDGLVGTS